MRRYLVIFSKRVPRHAPGVRYPLERQVVVTAPSGAAAAQMAKAILCETAGVVDWRLQADDCDVAELAS